MTPCKAEIQTPSEKSTNKNDSVSVTHWQFIRKASHQSCVNCY